MNIDFKYYLSIFWRRFPYFLVLTALFTSIGLTVAVILPAEYRASATLLMESPQIPDNLAPSTVRTGQLEQLQMVERSLLTRANLLDTADRLNVYSDEEQSLTPSQIVNDMRSRTDLRTQTGRNTATLLEISFRAPTSEMAAEVTNEFVTLVMQENVQMRVNRAGDTLNFFEQEVERLGGELDAQSTRILEFQTANADSLPDLADFLRDQRGEARERLDQVRRTQQGLRDQREQLIEIFERTGALGSLQERQSPEERALLQAQRELDEALLIYSPQNPRIRFLESRVELMQTRLATAIETAEGESPAEAMMTTQLAEIDSELDELDEEGARLETTIAELDSQLSRVPENSILLAKLRRDYSNIQDLYNRAVDRLAAAETGERIELMAKGQRITVLEQATARDRPNKPNRPVIAMAGAGAGIVAGLALIVLLEILNRSIRRPVELTDRLGITPFAVLPYLKTERETFSKRLVVLGVIAFLLVVVPAALFYLHTAVYPLDGLIEPIANRFGFSISLN